MGRPVDPAILPGSREHRSTRALCSGRIDPRLLCEHKGARRAPVPLRGALPERVRAFNRISERVNLVTVP